MEWIGGWGGYSQNVKRKDEKQETNSKYIYLYKLFIKCMNSTKFGQIFFFINKTKFELG